MIDEIIDHNINIPYEKKKSIFQWEINKQYANFIDAYLID